jgi:hypothetical protein
MTFRRKSALFPQCWWLLLFLAVLSLVACGGGGASNSGGGGGGGGGGDVDPWRFFRIRNVTRQVVKVQPKLTFQLRAAFTVLSMPKAPDIAPGKHCMSPIKCEFFDRCNPPLPDDHIGYLPRLHASAEEEL